MATQNHNPESESALQRLARFICGLGVLISGLWILVLLLVFAVPVPGLISLGTVWAEEGQNLVVANGALVLQEPPGTMMTEGPVVHSIQRVMVFAYFFTSLLCWMAMRRSSVHNQPMQADGPSGRY